MRKSLTTILLVLLALLSVTAAVFRKIDGSLARITGWYHFRPGMHLFPEENLKNLKNVSWMRISDLHDTIQCDRGEDGSWWIISPFRDRMSPMAVQSLLAFTAQAKLVDTLPLNRTTSASLREFGVESSPHTITLKIRTGGEGDRMSTIARYTLGSASPWLVDAEDGKHVLPTTYLRTDFYGRDKRIHVVRGNILSIFRNGLEGLRDPHVTDLAPEQLLTLEICREGAKPVRLTRPSAETPWTITAPIFCEADQDRVASLVSRITALKATRIAPVESVELPPAPELTLTLTPEGREPVVISIYPAFNSPSDGQLLCYATASDRPVVFTLPVEPRLRRRNSYATLVSHMLSMPVLPVSVISRLHTDNDTIYLADMAFDLASLRSARLSNIDSRDIAKVYLNASKSRSPLKLLRIPGDTEGQVQEMWLYSAEGKRFQEADSEIVKNFLESFSSMPVEGFELDLEPGQSPEEAIRRYGLNKPDFMLIVQQHECEVRAVLFGEDLPLVKDRAPHIFYVKRYRPSPSESSYWVAMEQNMLTIYRLSPRMIRLFATSALAWKKRNMVQFPISALHTLALHYQQAELVLHYDYIGEAWTGTMNGNDVTPQINPHRADYYVRHLQDIRVEKWLPEDDESALAALASPVFSISITLEETDYSDIESITIQQQADVDSLNTDTTLDADQVGKMINDDDEANKKFLQIATSRDRKTNRRTITLEIAPISLRAKKPQFYGRIRETGELFILSYDNAQSLGNNVLD